MEREEDKVWQAQLDIGGQINAGIDRILQLHLQEMFNVNTVGALPFFCSILFASVWHPLMSFVRSS